MLKLLKRYVIMAAVCFFLMPLASGNASILRIKVYPDNSNPKQIVVKYGQELKDNPLEYPYTYTYTVLESDTPPYLIEISRSDLNEKIEGGTTYYCSVKDVHADNTESSFSESSIAILTQEDCPLELSILE